MERQGLSPDIAAQLAQKLGNLPLALELAEQTLRRGVLAEDLIERIGDEGLTAIDTGISRDASASLFASLMFALEGLPQEDRLRLPMLAVLPPSRPVDLATFAENSGIGLLEGEAMARRVAAMSLIAFDDVNQTVSISPPVHAFLRSLQLRQDRAEANRRSSSGKVEGIIGISYRRDDAAAHAGRLYDRLSQRFGFDCVFLDVDAILPGENFVQATRRRMDGATAWLVVMGPNWARSVSSRGERRLDDPDDFVRIEVATALERDIPVIPVLVAGATMPRSEELPPDLQGLVHRQAIALDDSGFHQGVDQLIYALERSGTSSRPARLPAKIQEFQDGSAAEGRAEALRRIAACRTAQAEELDLGGLQLTVLDGELLAALCGLGWLRKLFLGPSVEDRGKLQLALANRERSSKLGNALVALPGALFDALKQLDRLDLAHNWLRGLPASTANLTALTSLDLTGNRIGDEGAQALKGLVNLTRLDMAGNEIGAAGATALKGLVNLTRLNLAGNEIGDEGAPALEGLVNLTSLNLAGNEIGAAGAPALEGLVNLTRLDLAGNEIGDEGAPALEGLVNLTSLNLAGNEIGDKGVQALKGLVNLTSLDLSYNNIGAEGAQALKGLVNLTSLDLAGNEVGDISPLVLLRNLRKINLSGSHLDHDVPAFWMLPSLQEVILHGARLPGVPVEILSRDGSFDNCLDRLRAHLADLTGDDVPVSDVKLMMLGNGRVGKTQICRRLRGESFDEAVPSTHGIQMSSLPLAPQVFDAPVTLKIWDFGGQDIYHGTHALFLNSRAIFLIVWTRKSEAEQFHTHGGFTFRNQPLAYWLAYVRTFGGARSPVLVAQSQCDRPEDERDPPLPEGALDGFGYRKLLHYSAKGDGTHARGHAALEETLLDAVRWMRGNQGVAKIGPGRAAVKDALEAKLAAGQRLISHQGYLDLCAEAERTGKGRISDPALLLDYLYNTGTVFYRKGLFGDQIILDQAWALEAIYAVFDRASQSFKKIERNHGRFRRSELAEWVWQKHGVPEQEQFLSFMQQCGICFTIQKEDHEKRAEAEYIAPDLLPARSDDETQTRLKLMWDEANPDAEAVLAFALLPPGLMRALIARIGSDAGLAAEYWRDGVCFYDERTASRALIEQRWTEGWAGEMRIATKRGQAGVLLQIKLVENDRISLGARPSGKSRRGRRHARTPTPRPTWCRFVRRMSHLRCSSTTSPMPGGTTPRRVRSARPCSIGCARKPRRGANASSATRPR